MTKKYSCEKKSQFVDLSVLQEELKLKNFTYQSENSSAFRKVVLQGRLAEKCSVLSLKQLLVPFKSSNSIQWKKDIEIKQMSGFENLSNKAAQPMINRKSLTSLPDLLEVKLVQIGDQLSSRRKENPCSQAHSLFNIQTQTLKQIGEGVLVKKVYSFLQEMIEDHQSCSNLLKDFQKSEHDVKISVKKSRRVGEDSNKMLQLHSLQDLSGRQQRKQGGEGKQVIKIKFTDLLQEEDSQNISIKILHSNIKLSSQDVTSIREIALSLGLLFSFRQVPGADQKSKIMVGQFKDTIIEDEEDKSNDEKDEQKGASEGKGESLYKQSSIIMLADEDDQQSGIFSSKGSIVSIENILKPRISLSQEILKKIFWNCSPFLINLSLCLMVKCLTKSKMELKIENISWLLSTATIISYKLFYDEEIQGLTAHYAKLLKMSTKDLVSLEIWFLHELSYQIHVTNRQYFEILSKLLKQKVLS